VLLVIFYEVELELAEAALTFRGHSSLKVIGNVTVPLTLIVVDNLAFHGKMIFCYSVFIQRQQD